MLDEILHTEWTWPKLEKYLHITPHKTDIYPDNIFVGIQEAMGFNVPISYQYYTQRWELGIIFDMFIIWTPNEEKDLDIREMWRSIKNLNLEYINNGIWKSKFHEQLKRLAPFGISQNGDILCWDAGIDTDEDEKAIYLLDSEQQGVSFVGGSLIAFFGDYCIDGKLNDVFPVGQGETWDFPLTFVPIQAKK